MISNVNAKLISLLAAIYLILPLMVAAYELSGYNAVEGRYFLHDSPFSEPENTDLSFVLAPEFYHQWDDGNQSLLVSPYFRLDSEDNERTHIDLRELIWLKATDDWELKLGVGRVFWGVTESQHLVDIINQTDLVENSDTEDNQ